MSSLSALPLLVVSLAVASACAPSKEDGSGRTSSAGTDGPNGSGVDGGTNGSGTGGGTGGGDLGGSERDGGGGGDLSPDAACAAAAAAPEAIQTEETTDVQIDCSAEAPEPINLYIVLDNSGSMDQNNKWPDAVNAITQFVQTPPDTATQWTCVDQDGNAVPPPADLAPLQAGAISVAIQYFHPQDNGGGTNECDGSGHAVPAVGMAPIPGNASAIITSMGATGPSGNTPTVGALTGGTQYCAQYQTQSGEKCVVVLVTDGQPNGCGLSSSNVAGGVDPNAASVLTPIASSAYANDSVITFTVGMNGVTTEGFALLDAIAVAGGSDCTPNTPGQETCDVSTTGSQGFLDALNAIRSSVSATDTSTQSVTNTVTTTTTLPCEWTIPSAPENQKFDKDKVNVTVTVQGTEQPLERVPTQADCAVTGGGWYYDDPDAPNRVLVCDDTCSTLKNFTDARVDLLFGCKTTVAKIR